MTALNPSAVAGDMVQSLLLDGSPLTHPVIHVITGADVTAGSVTVTENAANGTLVGITALASDVLVATLVSAGTVGRDQHGERDQCPDLLEWRKRSWLWYFDDRERRDVQRSDDEQRVEHHRHPPRWHRYRQHRGGEQPWHLHQEWQRGHLDDQHDVQPK